MRIGIFFHPEGRCALVAMDYKNWTEQITKAGFPVKPALWRKATTPEVVAYDERGDDFPAWVYTDFDELLDDEEKSGADTIHLRAASARRFGT